MRIASLLILSLLVAAPAYASDKKNNAAIKGAGLANCEQYLKANEEKNKVFHQFAGWANGFFTGYNIGTPETYDIAPWQSPGLIMDLLVKHCELKSNRKQRFADAMLALANTLHKQRVKELSERVAVDFGEGRQRLFYKDVIRKIQYSLAKQGHYGGPVSGSFSKETADAVRAFQRARLIPETGVPDQRTLSLLLLAAS